MTYRTFYPTPKPASCGTPNFSSMAYISTLHAAASRDFWPLRLRTPDPRTPLSLEDRHEA